MCLSPRAILCEQISFHPKYSRLETHDLDLVDIRPRQLVVQSVLPPPLPNRRLRILESQLGLPVRLDQVGEKELFALEDGRRLGDVGVDGLVLDRELMELRSLEEELPRS